MNRKKKRKQTTKHFKLFTTNYIYRTRCATVEWLPLRLMSDRARDKERRRSTLWEKFNFDMEKGQFSYHVSRVVVLQVQIYFVLSGLSVPALDKMKKFTLMLDDFSHCTPITVRVSCWWWSVHAINRYQFVFRVFLSKVDKCSRYECLAFWHWNWNWKEMKWRQCEMRLVHTLAQDKHYRAICLFVVSISFSLTTISNFSIIKIYPQRREFSKWIFPLHTISLMDEWKYSTFWWWRWFVTVVYLYSSEHALSG